MFQAQVHLTSGTVISTELDPPLADKLITNLLAIPGVVPRLLTQVPTQQELADRAGRLRLVSVALGELLKEQGTLTFLAQPSHTAIVNSGAVAAIELTDTDPTPAERRHVRVESRPEVGTPVG